MRRLSITGVCVLQAIADGFQYGFDIIDQTGLPSGTVYPALGRLERDGLVKSAWENDQDAHAEGRPARRYYEITAAGNRALNAARERLTAQWALFGGSPSGTDGRRTGTPGGHAGDRAPAVQHLPGRDGRTAAHPRA